MTQLSDSRALRFARWCLELALRLWPDDSRAWGHALAAELPNIARTSEGARWMFGGLFLFVRALGSRFLTWMKLSPGVTFADQPSSSSPRMPRFVVSLLLLATAVTLLLPQGREAVSTVRATWNGFELSAEDEQNLDRLAATAEKQRDAAAVAFVALRVSDAKRSLELRKRAVALDPSFVWIFSRQASQELPPQDATEAADQMERLRKSDPDNAFVYLLSADNVVTAHINTTDGAGVYFDENSLPTDPVWTSLMERAFRAPRYDSYSQRRIALARDIWSRRRDISVVTLAFFLESRRIPQLSRIRLFAEHQIRQAAILESTGSHADAENILTGISAFGDAMALGSETDIEKYIGLEISSKSLTELRTLYASTGRFSEADRLASQISSVQARMHFGTHPVYVDNAGVPRGNWRAAAVQSSGFVVLLSLVLSAFGLAFVELRSSARCKVRLPFQPLLTFSASYAPAVLFLSSLIFLLSYQSFARAFRDSLWANSSNAGIFVYNVFSLISAASLFLYIFNSYYRWLLCTVALSILALYLLFRTFRVRKPLT